MKITIVLDTEDREGLKDALQIANILARKHAGLSSYGRKAIFSKIELIKLLRAYGHECAKMAETARGSGEPPRFDGLREVKNFVDDRFDAFQKIT